MMSRASTMVLALLVLNFLLGVLCLVVARGERRSQALRLWGWGLLAYAVGLLITIPPAIPLDLRKVVGNALIAWAPVLTVDGLLRHTRIRLSRLWVGMALIATIAVLVVNHMQPAYSVVVDMLAPAPIANVLYVFAAVVLIRFPPVDAKSAARFLAGILAFSVLVWTARLLLIWLEIGGTNDRDRADLTVALFAIAQMVIGVAATLGLFWVEVRNMQAALQRLANDDALTGVPNRRATVARFEEEAARAERHGRAFSLVVFDVDSFKQVNDTYGHAFGDITLKHVASVLRANTRDVDAVGRIGGEEFVVILGEESSDGAVAAADRLRACVAATDVTEGTTSIRVTVSGGVATHPTDGVTWDALFTAADQRLYSSKRNGRNRVTGGSGQELLAIG
ncbi:MAG TPA: GGDEF domain-containing protein [Thermoanaerobaculia bacterium]|nr:GGDEF domain-containing protein [Thermoanaerobaculia bacterium]